MIQKKSLIASYVFERNGIFYFQLRVPKHSKFHTKYRSGLIRKSLKTSNYREAIKKARGLWLNYMSAHTTNEEIEKTSKYSGNLYTRGKEIDQVYKRINKNDYNAIEAFH